MFNKKYFFIGSGVAAIAVAGFFTFVFAADGSGTATVAPTSATAGSTGNTHAFTFTAGEAMDSGGISLTAPTGWTAPQGTAGTAGYTTVTTQGTIADIINSLESASGWIATHDGNEMTLSADTGDAQEGTASLSNSIAAHAVANEQWFFNYGGATNWGTANSTNGSRVGMWIKSSVATASGDLSWQDDNSASLASPLDTLAIPALSANTWTYTSVTLGAARTSVLSYGLRYTNDIGTATVKTDSMSVLFDAADVTTNWTSDANITRSLLNTSGNYKEGSAAIRCAYAAGAGTGTSGDCYANTGSFTIGPGGTVSFWVRSSVALNAGDFRWLDDNSTNFSSPADTVDLPALSANTWTYVTLSAANSSNLSVRSYGFRRMVNTGAVNIDIDAIGKQIDSGDSTTGWTVPSAQQTLSVDNAVMHEDGGSLKNVIGAGAVAGDVWYQTFGTAQNWSSYTTVGFWIRSTVATNAGDLKFQYATSDDFSSPIASLNIGALTANTWTYQKLTLTGTRTSVKTYGINYATDIGAATIYLDDVLAGPGSATFPGGAAVAVRFVALANGQTATITYGAGGGTSGATAPTTVETDTFTVRSRANDSGTLTPIASSPTISVTAGPVSQFTLNDPGNMTAGNRVGYTVTRKDQYGNAVTNGSTTVYLYSNSTGANKKFYDAASGGTVITSVTIGNGSSTANFWYYDETPGTWTVTASDNATAPDGATGVADATDSVTVSVGAVAQFTLNDPGNMIAGNRAGYTVTRKDLYGNEITTGTNTVYLYTNSSGGSAKFYNAASGGAQITSVTIGSGGSTAQFWYYDEAPGTWTVTASDNATAPDGATGIADATDTIGVSAGVVSQYVLNNPGDMTVGTRLPFTVTRKDSLGNQITTGTDVVYLYSSSSGAQKKFYDAASGGNVITSVTIAATTSTAQFWYYDETPGTWTITASDNVTAPDGTTGIDDGTQSTLVNSGAATQFTLNNPAGITAGGRAAYTVTRKDQFGNLATTGNITVYLYSNSTGTNKKFYDAASGGAIITSVTIGSGNSSANFWYYDELVGSWTITASDNATAPDGATGIADATNTTAVSAGPTAQFTMTQPSSMTAGTRLGHTVTRKDQYGNVVTSDSDTVYLYSNSTGAQKKFYNAAAGGSVVTSLTIGTASSTVDFWYYDEAAGSWTVTASDNATAPDNSVGIQDATNAVSVVANVVSQFTLNDPGDMATSTRIGYTVIRKDQFGNAVSSGSNTVYLYSSSTGANKNFYNAASGGSTITSVSIGAGSSSANFWYYDEAVGAWTITASDNASAPDGATGLADGTDTVTVYDSPVSPTRIVIVQPTDGIVGDNKTITVRVEDNQGRLDTAFQQDVTLNASGAATGAGLVDIVNGIGTKVITDTVAQTVTLSLTDSQSTGLNVASTKQLTFAPGAVAQFSLNDPGGMTAGTRLGYTVTRKDQYGNVVSTGNTTVYLYVNSSNGLGKFYNASSGGSVITSVTMGDGSSAAQFWYYDETAGSWVVTASDNASAPDDITGVIDAVDAVVVSASSVAQYTINNPGNMTAGTRLGYTVTRKDQFGNAVTSGSNTVYLYSSSTGAQKKFYSAASGGSVITSVIIGAGNSTADFWYYDELPGTWTITVSDNASAPDGSGGVADAADPVTVSAAPIVATRFVILNPADAMISSLVTVTVQAQDNAGNIDTTYQSDVTLVTDGSATGSGLVNIVNGVGTKVISDAVAETVNLSLSDTESTGLQISSTQDVVFSALPVVRQSNLGFEIYAAPNTLHIAGRAYPRAVVTVVEKAAAGDEVVKRVSANSTTGDFDILSNKYQNGVRVFALQIKDVDGRQAQTRGFRADFTAGTLDAVGLFIPPTIGLLRTTLTRGDFIKVSGYASPLTTVQIEVDHDILYETASKENGAYELLINTARLAPGTHTVRARQLRAETREPGEFSLNKTFTISALTVPGADLNNDGVVDIRDSSIFLELWRQKKPEADLNKDGAIDVTDLSIFLRAFKK